MPFLFALTLLISATLLFLVQPLIANMIRPMLGGTPAVWNTCMVFFQAMLLAGYTYAHAVTTRLPMRRQVLLHGILLFLPLVVLPVGIAIAWMPLPPGDANPIPWQLALLAVAVGLPFFVLSTSAPLLQKWFASTGHPSAKDPYFLYAASNLGSMVALLSYPLLVERYLVLKPGSWQSPQMLSQSWLWSMGYGILAALVAVCGWFVWQRANQAKEAVSESAATRKHKDTPQSRQVSVHAIQAARQVGGNDVRAIAYLDVDRPSFLTRLHWVALAFVPSSLMLGVTTYISTDVAAIPLLWVLPLALYLLSFILVFTRMPLLLRVIDFGLLAGLVTFVTMPQLVSVLAARWHLEMGPGITIGLWAIRLALYAFVLYLVWRQEAGWFQPRLMLLAMPLILLLLVFFIAKTGMEFRLPVVLGLHLLALFVVSMVCHGALARNRPATRYLTDFYLLMSVGGVLGGMFNALLAPLVFKSIAEYPLAMVFAAMLLPRMEPEGRGWLHRWYQPSRTQQLIMDGIAAALLLVGGVLLFQLFTQPAGPNTISNSLSDYLDTAIRVSLNKLKVGPPADETAMATVKNALITGLLILVCYSFVTRPIRFGLGVGAILLAPLCSDWIHPRGETVLHQERSFFGVIRVTSTKDGRYHRLSHGTTLHGEQCMDPEWRAEPLTYYHQTGPIGQLFDVLNPRPKVEPAMLPVPWTVAQAFHLERHSKDKKRLKNMAFIGLGSGTLACYGHRGQSLTFYEIDPAVVRIAQNPDYFTFYQDCVDRGAKVQVILGDARLRVKEAPDASYDLIVVDAFSSDAIPIHLITREALELYFKKLTPDGSLLVHISNRHLDLEPVLGNLAEQLNLQALNGSNGDKDDIGRAASQWVLLTRSWNEMAGRPLPVRGEIMRELGSDMAVWCPIKTNPEVGVWTDDYSNLLSVLMWDSVPVH